MDQIRNEVVEVLDEEEEVTLPGFRFHPTDEELVGFYLRRKVEKKSISREIIKHVDIYKYDPWDLPRVSNLGDKEWYFFCQRGMKYRNSIRPNRVTGSGFWKATGIDRPIYATGGGHGDCIGLKKSLVYYRGSAGKGTKTDWMMHEFRLPSAGSSAGKFHVVNHSCIPEGETWTICRIFKRTTSHKRSAQTQSSWKNIAPSTKAPTETCSAESNSDDDHQHLLASNFQHSDNNSVITCYEDNTVQFYDTNSGSVYTQAPSAASHSSEPSSNPNEFFFREGSWDELGTMVEFTVDPFFFYDCRY